MGFVAGCGLLGLMSFCTRFSDPNRSLNRKREMFKVFEVEPRSNRDRTGIEL